MMRVYLDGVFPQDRIRSMKFHGTLYRLIQDAWILALPVLWVAFFTAV